MEAAALLPRSDETPGERLARIPESTALKSARR